VIEEGATELECEATGITGRIGDLGLAEQPVGLVGMDVLSSSVIVYDVRRSAISLHDPESYELPRGEWSPMVAASSIQPTIRMTFEGHEGSFVIDTGNPGAVIVSPYTTTRYELLHDRTTSRKQLGGTGGSIAARRGQFKWVNWGGRRACRVPWGWRLVTHEEESMAKLEFDDEGSRLVEEFNASAGAIARRARIQKALTLKPGNRVLDVGSGPGHQVFDMSLTVGATGRIDGVDPAESALEIGRRRCSELSNTSFRAGEASNLPFDDATFDAVMSSQVFEYLDDVAGGLAEAFRVLKPGGRVLIHDTDWGALLWHSSDAARMARIMKCFEGHLTDPHLPHTLGPKLGDAGFVNVSAEPIVHVETSYDPSSVSAIIMKFVVGYVVSHGISQVDAEAWANDLRESGAEDHYFFSSNEYIFTADKP
jgi:SAM-dependent methyltransferase